MMKRIRVICVFMAVAIVLLSGCTKRGAAEGKTRHKNIYTKEECQKPYGNVIEKCVGAKGTPYKAYDRLQTWISIGYQDARYSSDEWVDSEENIKLPFDKEELLKDCNGGRMFFAYYVPDDVAAKASTKELVDICLDYFDQDTTFWEFDFTAANEIEWLLKDNNALEETLRRDDFATAYYDKYMELDYPDYISEEENSDEYWKRKSKYGMLTVAECILVLPEACDSLSDEQRTNLVKKLIKEYQLSSEGKTISDSAAPGGYVRFFAWVVEGNSWYYAINEMNLTDDEWKVIDRVIQWNEKEGK